MSNHFEKDYQYHQVIAREYDDVVVAPRVVTNDYLYSRFSPLVKPGERMLDLACGTGHMTLRFGGRFREVVAIDHSDAMLERAREKAAAAGMSNVDFRQGNIFEFQAAAAADSFDLVCCTGFLHHLLPAQIPETAAQLFPHIRKGGLIMTSEPIKADAPPSVIRKWNEKSVMTSLNYSVHAEAPDEEAIELGVLVGALAGAGFCVEKTYRNWEIYPKNMPPGAWDRIAIITLNLLYGKNGNVFTIAARKD